MKKKVKIYYYQACGVLTVLIWATFEGLRRIFTRWAEYWDIRADAVQSKVSNLKGWF